MAGADDRFLVDRRGDEPSQFTPETPFTAITQGSNGEFLSDVAVRLLRDEQEIATFRAAGPRCLIRAPEGSYNIEASYKGQAKSIKVSTGTRNAQLRW